METMTTVAALTVRFPKWRLSVAGVVARVIGPLVPHQWQGVFIDALADWTCRGLRFTEHRAVRIIPPKGSL